MDTAIEDLVEEYIWVRMEKLTKLMVSWDNSWEIQSLRKLGMAKS